MVLIEPRDFSLDPLQVFACGAGEQSTAIMGLIFEGKLPPPDLIIMSDTGSELRETMHHVETVLKPFAENVLKIPFVIVTAHEGKLHEHYFEKGLIPIIGIRSCTAKFKIRPQRRFIRTIVGNKPRGKVLAEVWLGITTDEESRRAVSDVQWCALSYPLLDALPMSRDDCRKVNERMGWEVKKSGCFCCPYAGAKTWLKLKEDHPDLFQLAVDLENHASIAYEKKTGKPLRSGLLRGKKLSRIHDPELLNDSACDSDAGCFI